ncbi:hypothetical protein RUM4293_00910 [Ruegeria atlantica]|uniref:Uncharacterized protein n=1 Tax=Ruegeria atlantica TaxID=81569 RepID=A0A0P1E4K7_9RHOB|nr:hypothetical protein RUM4293_00910 [Ruegeria atlantica]
MDIWFYVGLGLLIWAIRELVFGSTYLWERFTRAENPGAYWVCVLVWLVVASAILATSPTTYYMFS